MMTKVGIILFTSTILLATAGFVFASASEGTIDSTYKYVWSNEIGWINFGPVAGNVRITDSDLTGYAWSENYGWINLNPLTGGVKNNGEGSLSGYAWGEGVGWINFSGVTININGEFTGAATGDFVGIINFNCSDCLVKTDWRPASVRKSVIESGGGALPGMFAPPAPPFRVLINDGRQYTNNQIVTLNLKAGVDTKRVAISNFPDFKNAVQEDYQPIKSWDLCRGQEEICKNSIPATGLSLRVYVKFYTQYGQSSEPFSAAIILDNQPPAIEATNIKNLYNSDEDIILSGLGEPNSVITLYWANQYGLGYVDEQGRWLVNLGKLPAGNYPLRLTPKDAAGNIGKVVMVDLIIETVPSPKPSGVSKIIDRLKIAIKPFIPKIFLPKTLPPEAIVTVPEKAPLSLSGKWPVISQKQLKEFVLAPLPKEIKAFAIKFPQIERTFEKVGITKITDIGKLRSAKIILPGLTEITHLPKLETEPIKFSLPKGIPLVKLTKQAKDKIPTEIVFVRGAGGLIDYNIILSLNDKNQPEQTINVISNKSLELSVKTDKPVKKVMGYLVFKSKKPRTTFFKVPLELLTASLVVPNPNLSYSQKEPINVEEKLVLLEFEYTDLDEDGIYTANIQSPVVDGEYEIITLMDYQDPEIGPRIIRLTTVVDPEGYVYEKDGDKEIRINGAIVSIYWLNPETKQYELWPAKEYNQENPQITDVRGVYSFLTPEGYYYLKVDAPGYLSYDGKPFQVKEGSGIHINIELKTKYWWIKIIDWKTGLLLLVTILLLYNFYRDKINKIKNKELKINP